MSDNRLRLLRDMPVFGGIRADTLTLLLELAPVVSHPAGDFFFCEGAEALSMFVLEEGRVAILKDWNGHQHLLRYLKTGDCFGEMALIDLYPRSASVQADTDCAAIELTPAMLYEIYNRDAEQFAMIQMNIARELSRRLRASDERLFRALAYAESIDDELPILT